MSDAGFTKQRLNEERYILQGALYGVTAPEPVVPSADSMNRAKIDEEAVLGVKSMLTVLHSTSDVAVAASVLNTRHQYIRDYKTSHKGYRERMLGCMETMYKDIKKLESLETR